MHEYLFTVTPLDCAHCAAKIEEKIQQMPQVESATLTFATRQLRVCTRKPQALLPQLQAIVSSVEPDWVVTSNDEKPQESGRKPVLPLVLGGALFAAGLLLPWKYASLSAFVAAYLLLGWSVLVKAGKGMIKGRVFDENFLMALATVGAFAIGEWAEAVGVMLFYRIGTFFEDRAVQRSRSQILDAVDLCPEQVWAQRGEEFVEIPIRQAKIGDLLLVHPGDRIPLDGRVIAGESRIDTAPITGESVPIRVCAGEAVISGWVNLSGQLTVQVEKPLEESMATRILQAVETAAAGKPKMDRFITRFSKIYTPAVVAIAALTAILPSIITGQWNYWVYTALSFLVMSCPCALVLSVPLAFFSGIGAGSRQGILFKGGTAMEALARIRAVAMDKTGTLTEGNFCVQQVVGPENLLKICAACEQGSTHPVAQSILAAAGGNLPKPEQLEELAGLGISAQLQGRQVLCGNTALLEKFGVSCPGELPQSGTCVLVAVDGCYQGYILISDTVKPDSKKAVQQLHTMGISTAMLTGDRENAARAVASAVGIKQVFARLLPHQKFGVLEQLRKEEGRILYVGDGINDAPVLAGADVGAAMGSGADAAIEAADVVYLTARAQAIPDSIRIARRTQAVAWQNVVFALAVKLGVMVLGLLGFANMWLAVLADSGVALLCVLNSIRILYTGNKIKT